MRILHVLEVRSNDGFLPKVGFATPDLVLQWMNLHLPTEVLNNPAEWRIVEYIPAMPELVH